MDAERIVQDLKRRFDEPLPEFYKRRIVFWHDEEQEFGDLVDTLSLDGVTVVRLTGSNFFAVKKLLALDDTESNYLVYCPLSFAHLEDNWLLNMELYSGEVFRADLYSMWMDEMGLKAVPHDRLKKYHDFFQSEKHREKIRALSNNITSPAQLHLAVMAVICGTRDLNQNILRAVLSGGTDAESNAAYQDIVRYGAKEAFWSLAWQATGYRDSGEQKSHGSHEGMGSLAGLAAHILTAAMSRTMRKDIGVVQSLVSVQQQLMCYDLVSGWLHSSDKKSLKRIAGSTEEDLRLADKFASLEIEDLLDTECFPCINEVILIKLMTGIGEKRIQPGVIKKTVEKRRTMAWYEDTAGYYEGLCQAAVMQSFQREHSQGFHAATPQDIWKNYTEDYYMMDMSYRQFRLYFNRSLKAPNERLDDLFKNVASEAEKLYCNWYLAGLAANWSSVAEEDLEKYGFIPGVERQTSFYGSHVRNSDTRVFVIISDALRYEVAASLAEQLRQETQSRVDLDSMCAVFPTVTHFGMAALLPHDELSVQKKPGGGLYVLADGQQTAGLDNRDKVLKSANKASIALKYSDLIGLRRTESRELIRGNDVVYIYHDKIDEDSHSSDSNVFQACQNAVEEIKSLVRIIVQSFSGTRILITADHGFLYTGDPLAEDGKVSRESWNGGDAEYGSRYAIMEKGTRPDYLMPVRFLDGKTDYEGFAPRENVRISIQGAARRFVHGGISLQEMVVPLIKYHYLRKDNREYQKNKAKIDTKPVEIGLQSSSRKISNMLFQLDFYQKEAVGSNREKTSYALWFVDSSDNQVSSTVSIIADKTDKDDNMSFHCTFNLKPLKFDKTKPYYLLICRDGVLENPDRYEFQIDIPFACEDFNFF